MKVSSFEPKDRSVPMFSNIDTSVGQNGNNSNTEDILLVQFLLKKNGERVPANNPEGQRQNEVLKKVPVTGRVDKATIDGIVAFQQGMKTKIPSTTIDGRVSPARAYTYGAGYFSIVAMSAFIRLHCKEVWPRLQDFSDCPQLLKAKVAEVL